MDTKKLVADMKARFAHNSAKHYLAEKYSSKLLVADQGGLWKADKETLTFLYDTHLVQKEIVLLDTYNTPVKVDCLKLYKKLMEVYNTVMDEWHTEYKELENKR